MHSHRFLHPRVTARGPWHFVISHVLGRAVALSYVMCWEVEFIVDLYIFYIKSGTRAQLQAQRYHRDHDNNALLRTQVFFWIFLILSKFFITPLIIAVMLEHMAQEVRCHYYYDSDSV